MSDGDVFEVVGWSVAMFLAFMLVLVATHPPTPSDVQFEDQQTLAVPIE